MNNRAFTLIELMVAMSLLAILGLMLSSITSMISQSTRLSNRTVDAVAQARVAFDRMGTDLAGSFLRTDMDFVALNPPVGSKNDFLKFMSAVSSANPATPPPGFINRNASLVGYRIAPNPDDANRPCLMRAGKALGWNDRFFIGLGTNGYPPLLTNTGPFELLDADYDVLAPAVIRALVGFQLIPDNAAATLLDGTSIANALGQIVYSPPVRAASDPGKFYIDTRRVRSLIIALVVMDPNSLKLVNGTGITTLSAAFSGVPAQNQLPLSKWMADTSDLANLPSTVLMPVRQSVRLYQRAYPLNTDSSQNP